VSEKVKLGLRRVVPTKVERYRDRWESLCGSGEPRRCPRRSTETCPTAPAHSAWMVHQRATVSCGPSKPAGARTPQLDNYRPPRTCACKRSFSSRSLSKITADCSWRSWTTPFTLLRRVVKEGGARQSVSRQGPAAARNNWEGDEPDEEVGRGQERGLGRQEQYAVPPHEPSRLQVVHLEHVRQTETVFLSVAVGGGGVQQQSLDQSVMTPSVWVAGVREALVRL